MVFLYNKTCVERKLSMMKEKTSTDERLMVQEI